MKDQGFLAARAGFVLDAIVNRKNFKDSNVYKIIGGDGTNLFMEQVTHINPEKLTVSCANVLNDWKLWSGKVSQLLPGYDPVTNDCSPLNSKSWFVDSIKGVCCNVLRQSYAENEAKLDKSTIAYYVNPNCARAVTNIPKKALCLTPASQRLDTKSSPNSFCLGSFSVDGHDPIQIFVTPQTVHPDVEKAHVNAWIAPFFKIGETKETDSANLRIEWTTVKAMGFDVDIPMLVNSHAIKAGAELKWMRPVDGPVYRGERKKRKANE